MGMTKDDLSRPYLLDVCAAGTVHIRGPGDAKVKGTLPVFSADTEEQAKIIRVTHCRLARDGSGLYALNETPQSIDDLANVSDMFRATRAKLIAAKA